MRSKHMRTAIGDPQLLSGNFYSTAILTMDHDIATWRVDIKAAIVMGASAPGRE